ncbi:MAG: glycosyltransferase [Armatimonadota bacterium]
MSWTTTNSPPVWLVLFSAGAILQIVSVIWGYPWYVRKRAARCGPPAADTRQDTSTPTVCVLIAAHNEARYIQRRLQNLHEQIYTATAIRVVVICDGCIDNTAELARLEGVEVIELPDHFGKSHALHIATDHLGNADAVVLTDARPLFAPDAIQNLVAALKRPGVAAVSGVLKLSSPSMLASPIGRYWHAETALRNHQTSVSGTTGCTGPICTCWRRYWRAIPSGIVLDDVWLAVDIAAQGGQVSVCPNAIAWDDRAYNMRSEWMRKLRTSAGNWQLMFTPGFWRMLLRSGKFWHWFFHKLGRLLIPFSVLLLFGAVVASWPSAVLLLPALVIATILIKPRCGQLLLFMLAPIAGLAYLLTGKVDGRWTSEPTDATL